MSKIPEEKPQVPSSAASSPSKALDTILILIANIVIMGVIGFFVIAPIANWWMPATDAGIAGLAPLMAFAILWPPSGLVVITLLLLRAKNYPPLQKYSLGIWICFIFWAVLSLPSLLLVCVLWL